MVHTGADRTEAVGHHQAAGDGVPQSPLDVLRETIGGGTELAGEARTAFTQDLQHLGCRADHRFTRIGADAPTP